MNKKQVVLIVLDGWGYREKKENNAIAQAKTPCFDYLWNKYSTTLLKASGLEVGLPDGQMGNSEVGHMTIGAGRIIDTDLVRISKAAENNQFLSVPAFVNLFNHVQKNDSVLHIKGLIGPGGIHSHHDHLIALLKSAHTFGLKKIALHIFTDGRDTPPQSASAYIEKIEAELKSLNVGFIASVSGRYYAMDRDGNIDRVQKVLEALFKGNGHAHKNITPSQVVKELYDQGLSDEFIEPQVFIAENGQPYTIKEHDGVIFFNFRSDRARLITKLTIEETKNKDVFHVTMTEYEKGLPVIVAFEPQKPETTLAAEISQAGLSQAHIAETEKYAHATFFLNGGDETPHDKEEYVLIESRKDVTTHDLAPEMKASEITDKTIEQILKDTDFIFINFANPDMVGHTANFKATVKAIECVDTQLQRIINLVEKRPDTIAFITADHGNAEENLDENEQPHTAHTTNLVPAILVGAPYDLAPGGLADVAPTILTLLWLKIPKPMTGKNLLIEKPIRDNVL